MVAIAVRPARAEDAAAIADIYNQGIRGRGATFETEERTPEERARWLAAHDEHHLWWLEMHPLASRGALVGMVEATEDRHRADRPRTTRHLPR